MSKSCIVYFLPITNDVTLPTRADSGSAGYDVYAHHVDEPVITDGISTVVVRTGLMCAFDENFVMKVYPRSGLAFKFGINLINSVGIIDSSYRGEILIKLTANTVEGAKKLSELKKGDRIAQFIMQEIPDITIIKTTELPESERGSGGFGSTGA